MDILASIQQHEVFILGSLVIIFISIHKTERKKYLLERCASKITKKKNNQEQKTSYSPRLSPQE